MIFPFSIFIIFLLKFDSHFALLNTNFGGATEDHLHPVFLVHGFTGSKVYVSGKNIQYPPKHKCMQNETAFHKSWISKYKLVRNPDCEFYWMGLDHNEADGTFQDRAGVNVSFHDQDEQFGGLESIQCLWNDKGWKWFWWSCTEPYFHPLVLWLQQNGYTEAKNLFGAVYDWRHHPSSPKLNKFYAQLKAKIEWVVAENGGKKAILLAHSYGNIILHHFLWKWTDKEWRQKNVESTVNVAAPFGGSSHTVFNLLLGVDQKFAGISLLKAIYIRDFVRSIASPAILMPHPNAFNSSHSFVEIGQNEAFHFGLDKIEEFFWLTNSSHLLPIYRDRSISHNGEIPMYCIFGINVDVKVKIRFNEMQSFLDGSEPNEIIYGDGDGTVNIESLRVCQKWKEQNEKISVLELPGEDHKSVLSSQKFFNHLSEILFGKLRKSEHFAVVEEPKKKIGQKMFFSKPRTRRQFCIEEKVAKCPLGMKPNRWIRKNVEIICFNGQQNWELFNGIQMGKRREYDEEMMELMNSKFLNEASKTTKELRDVVVPLTCI